MLASLQEAGESVTDVEVVVPRIPLASLIASYFEEEIIAGKLMVICGK
jgi:hypothetical protein